MSLLRNPPFLNRGYHAVIEAGVPLLRAVAVGGHGGHAGSGVGAWGPPRTLGLGRIRIPDQDTGTCHHGRRQPRHGHLPHAAVRFDYNHHGDYANGIWGCVYIDLHEATLFVVPSSKTEPHPLPESTSLY